MKQGKRVLAGLLALVMLVSSLTVAAFAAASAGMEVTTTSGSLTNLKAGDTVTVKITLPALEKLGAAGLEMTFNKDLLEYKATSAIQSDFKDKSATLIQEAKANASGEIAFNISADANFAVAANANLLTVNFVVREGVNGSAEFAVKTLDLEYVGDDFMPVSITYVTAPAAKTVVIPKAPITEVTASGISIPHTGNLAPTYSPAPATTPAPGEEADPYEFAGFAWFKSMEDAENNRNALTSTDRVMGSTKYVVRLVFKANTADGNIFADKVAVKLNGTSIGEFTPNSSQR